MHTPNVKNTSCVDYFPIKDSSTSVVDVVFSDLGLPAGGSLVFGLVVWMPRIPL